MTLLPANCYVGASIHGEAQQWFSGHNKDLLIAGDIGTRKSAIALSVATQLAVDFGQKVFVADANHTHAGTYEPLLNHLAGACYGRESVTELLERLAETDEETYVILEGTHILTRGRDPWRTIPALSGAVNNPHVHMVVVAVQIYELSSILRPGTARIVMGTSLRRNRQMVIDTIGKAPLPVSPFGDDPLTALYAVGTRYTWLGIDDTTPASVEEYLTFGVRA